MKVQALADGKIAGKNRKRGDTFDLSREELAEAGGNVTVIENSPLYDEDNPDYELEQAKAEANNEEMPEAVEAAESTPRKSNRKSDSK